MTRQFAGKEERDNRQLVEREVLEAGFAGASVLIDRRLLSFSFILLSGEGESRGEGGASRPGSTVEKQVCIAR